MAQKETEQLTRILSGVALSRAVCSIAELGVADLIESGRPQPVEHLARASKTHEPSLYRILRFVAAYGIFQETANRQFDHTPLSAALRTDAPGSFRAGAQMFHHLFPAWDGLHQSIQTGEPGFNKVFGAPVFDYIQKHPALGPVFDAGMTSLNGYETPGMLDAYDFSGINVLADIGGGNGSLLSALLTRYPHMKAILFDLGHVAGRATERLKAAGLAGRCSVIAGSFFESIPAGADAYLFRHIIHDWTDEQCIQILGHCRKVIPASGKLLIADGVVPAGNAPHPAKDLDMTMLTYPGGQERTEAQFRSLLQASGFELKSITPTTTMISVVEAISVP
ncbi:MAG TPA: methyltransferase [Candidatus Acidoferrales bacterium]|nr:methyltransferase [Candidatus Acidoferrales bacterium]